jgi:hypothetical protein
MSACVATSAHSKSASDQALARSFDLVNKMKNQLVKKGEREPVASTMLQTMAEWDAARQRVRAERRAARSGQLRRR